MTIVDDELLIEVALDRHALHGPKEFLAIAVDEQGVRHAMYPTDDSTLCSLVDVAEVIADGEPPDCLLCATTARVWDRVDRSAPSAWFRNGAKGAA